MPGLGIGMSLGLGGSGGGAPAARTAKVDTGKTGDVYSTDTGLKAPLTVTRDSGSTAITFAASGNKIIASIAAALVAGASVSAIAKAVQADGAGVLVPVTLTGASVTPTPGPTPTPTPGYEAESTALFAAWTGKGAAPSEARKYQANRVIARIKAAGMNLSDFLSLAIIVHGDGLYDQTNWASPGTRDPKIVGTPTATANNGYIGGTGSYIDTLVPINSIPQDAHTFGVIGGSATTGATDFGAWDGTNGYSINTLNAGTMSARSSGPTSSGTLTATGYWDGTGLHVIRRSSSAAFDYFKGPVKVGTYASASVAITSTVTMRMLGFAPSGTNAKRQYASFISKVALSDAQIKELHDALNTYIESVLGGEVRIVETGTGPSSVTVQHVVYGTTSAALAHAIQLARDGESVVIVAERRIKRFSQLGGMSANGLGYVDVRDVTAFGGLSRTLIGGAVIASGSAWSNAMSMEPRIFNRQVRGFLDPTRSGGFDIPVYLADGIYSVTKTGKQLTSITTVDGRTFNASYAFHDGTYDMVLGVAAGVSYVLGREAAGSGKEANNGVLGFGNALGNPTTDIDPYVIPGNAASGRIYGVDAEPAITSGQADVGAAQAVNFRLTMTNNLSRMYPVPNTPPVGYSASKYELVGRLIAAGYYTTFGAMFSIQSASGVNDFNNKGPGSLDFCHDGGIIRYYQALYAKQYATAEAVYQEVVSWTAGLLYWLCYENDARITSTIRNTALTYGYAFTHYTDRNPADPGHYMPGVLYVREGARLVGDFILNGNDSMVDGTTPRSTNTCAMMDYETDSHYFRRAVSTTTGTPRVRLEGSLNVTAGGADGVQPIPFEVTMPKASEITNLTVSFGISATHVAFCSSRMELPAIQIGQSTAVLARLARQAGAASLQAYLASNYESTIKPALLAVADVNPPVLRQVN